MLTDVQIINDGLALVSASRINRIDPPKTPLELFVSARYKQWKASELAKRRWVFASAINYTLTLTDTLDNVDKPYVYPLPNDCLRPYRGKYTEWIQIGRDIHSVYDVLKIDYIRDVDESEFDPLFNDVLSARVAVGCGEYVSQSNTKKDYARDMYKDAVKEAGKANAFVIAVEDVQEDDSQFSWVSSRYA